MSEGLVSEGVGVSGLLGLLGGGEADDTSCAVGEEFEGPGIVAGDVSSGVWLGAPSLGRVADRDESAFRVFDGSRLSGSADGEGDSDFDDVCGAALVVADGDAGVIGACWDTVGVARAASGCSAVGGSKRRFP